jgi:hypothetical protein
MSEKKKHVMAPYIFLLLFSELIISLPETDITCNSYLIIEVQNEMQPTDITQLSVAQLENILPSTHRVKELAKRKNQP